MAKNEDRRAHRPPRTGATRQRQGAGGLGRSGARRLERCQQNLARLERLIAEAGERLSDSFERLHALAAALLTAPVRVGPAPCLARAANDAPAAAPPSGTLRPGALADRHQLEAVFASAVTALQFQDLATQLIGRVCAELGALGEPAVAGRPTRGPASGEALGQGPRLAGGTVELFD